MISSFVFWEIKTIISKKNETQTVPSFTVDNIPIRVYYVDIDWLWMRVIVLEIETNG